MVHDINFEIALLNCGCQLKNMGSRRFDQLFSQTNLQNMDQLQGITCICNLFRDANYAVWCVLCLAKDM